MIIRLKILVSFFVLHSLSGFLVAVPMAFCEEPLITQGQNRISIVDMSICELEEQPNTTVSYASFNKDPDAFDLGQVTIKDEKSYIILIKKSGSVRCDWRIRAALEISDEFLLRKSKESFVSFNCVVLHRSYASSVAFIGLVEPGQLEYDHPIRAWSINKATKEFSKISTSNVYCPLHF